MKPAPSETAELLHRVRQQLILAQVRIMELEDVRDELAPKLVNTEKLLTAAQELADQKMADAEHLEKVRADLQVQYEHMRHMQHVTNEALNQTRREMADLAAALAATTERATGAEERSRRLQEDLAQRNNQLAQLNSDLHQLKLELVESNSTAAGRLERLTTLESEIRAMKTSRSWRWMAWLRALERRMGGR